VIVSFVMKAILYKIIIVVLFAKENFMVIYLLNNVLNVTQAV